MSKINSYLFSIDWWRIIRNLSDEDRLALYDSINKYVFDDEDIELKDVPYYVFITIREQITDYLEKKKHVSEVRSRVRSGKTKKVLAKTENEEKEQLLITDENVNMCEENAKNANSTLQNNQLITNDTNDIFANSTLQNNQLITIDNNCNICFSPMKINELQGRLSEKTTIPPSSPVPPTLLSPDTPILSTPYNPPSPVPNAHAQEKEQLTKWINESSLYDVVILAIHNFEQRVKTDIKGVTLEPITIESIVNKFIDEDYKMIDKVKKGFISDAKSYFQYKMRNYLTYEYEKIKREYDNNRGNKDITSGAESPLSGNTYF